MSYLLCSFKLIWQPNFLFCLLLISLYVPWIAFKIFNSFYYIICVLFLFWRLYAIFTLSRFINICFIYYFLSMSSFRWSPWNNFVVSCWLSNFFSSNYFCVINFMSLFCLIIYFLLFYYFLRILQFISLWYFVGLLVITFAFIL